MTDLTEKFFNEEDIPNGLYYLKLKTGEVIIDDYPEIIHDAYGEFEHFGFKDTFIDNIEEILAPVPSYEELQSLEADKLAKNEGSEIVAELKEENANLRELLKYCVIFLEYAETSHNLPKIIRKSIRNLITEINEVLK